MITVYKSATLIVTPTSRDQLSETWKAWLDTISEFLDRLTFEGGEAIPVVFRLFHEGNPPKDPNFSILPSTFHLPLAP